MEKINLEEYKPFEILHGNGIVAVDSREQKLLELATKINEIIDLISPQSQVENNK